MNEFLVFVCKEGNKNPISCTLELQQLQQQPKLTPSPEEKNSPLKGKLWLGRRRPQKFSTEVMITFCGPKNVGRGRYHGGQVRLGK